MNSCHLHHLQGTELLPCDWVACLQPPQAPAYTHLRHTGWWGFKNLLKSEMIHICQVWRPYPIWRECQFCLWEGDGFWGGLPSNILWSDMSGLAESSRNYSISQILWPGRIREWEQKRVFFGSRGWWVAKLCQRWSKFSNKQVRSTLQKSQISGPLCSAPPEVPFEGNIEVVPGIFQAEPISSCQVWKQSSSSG